MPSEHSVAVLYDEIFRHFAIQRDFHGGAPGFRLVFTDDREVRVDYDAEDDFIWLTTPFVPDCEEMLPRLLPRLLQLNFAGAAHGTAYCFDPQSNIVFLQSRIEAIALHLDGFEAAVQGHLDAIDSARNELAAAAEDAAAQEIESLPAAGQPVVWG
jgi:hypothetical protein